MMAYRVRGTTDEFTTCEMCGRSELKGTVAVEGLDLDGNVESISYFGRACAAKAAGWTVSQVGRFINASLKEAREQRLADLETEHQAESDFIARWYVDHYGTSDVWVAAKAAGMPAPRLAHRAIMAFRDSQR